MTISLVDHLCSRNKRAAKKGTCTDGIWVEMKYLPMTHKAVLLCQRYNPTDAILSFLQVINIKKAPQEREEEPRFSAIKPQDDTGWRSSLIPSPGAQLSDFPGLTRAQGYRNKLCSHRCSICFGF